MRVQVGQIPLPAPEAGANPLLMAVVLTLIGIMEAARVEALILLPAPVAVEQVLVILLLVDVDQAGLILPHALAKHLHHKDVITYQRRVAEADLHGTLRLVLAVHRAQVHPPQPERPLRLAEEQVAAPVHPDITGCLTLAGGACLMAQLAAVLVLHRLQLLRQPQPNRAQHHQQLLQLSLLVKVTGPQLLVHRIKPPLNFQRCGATEACGGLPRTIDTVTQGCKPWERRDLCSRGKLRLDII